MLTPGSPSEMTDWGLKTMALIRKEYRIDAIPGYCDALEPGKKPQPVFNWGLGVLLSAMNGAAKADPEWKADLRKLVDASRAYWNTASPVAGYDVLPGSKRHQAWHDRPGHDLALQVSTEASPSDHYRDGHATTPAAPDRYYDDNAWMVLALVETCGVLQDKSILKQAEAALKFVLSGQDDKLGGGIYWRESDKKSKNTCSNAPSAAACLAVWEKTKDPGLLEMAKTLYAWTKGRLQDPTDLLFWDNVGLDGKVEKTKWSYNTALMIRTAAMLYKATREGRYAKEAEAMASASEKRWFVGGKVADAGRFAHLLLESWGYVPTPERREKAKAALEWLWRQGRNEQGYYGGQFNHPPANDQKRFELIDQASAARAMFIFGSQKTGSAE